MSEASDFSESGDPIYRHTEPTTPGELVTGDSENIQAISQHIESFIGPIETVFHELLSPRVHIDVHIVAPSEERPVYTLVTSGMSDLPMTVPEGCESLRWAELMLCLPPDWPMTEEDWKNEDYYWPLRALKFLARFPHEYNTWLFMDHTVPNGNPIRKFGQTDFCCSLITAPSTVPAEFFDLPLSEEKVIRFYAVQLLYREEMDLKLKKGADRLLELLDKIEASELVEVGRKNVAQKRFGFF